MIYKNHTALLAASQRAFLIYGTDEGKIYLTANKLREKLNCETHKIDAENIEKSPAMLQDSLQSQSLFGGASLFMVDLRDMTINIKLQNQLLAILAQQENLANYLLILAHSLPTSAKLRKFFESNQHCAIMPCYAPDAKDIASELKKRLREANLTIDAAGEQLFLQKIASNTGQVEQEINKLLLYKESGAVSFEDIQKLIGHKIDLQMGDLIYASFSGDKRQMENLLANIELEAMQIILSIRRHVTLLIDIRDAMLAQQKTASQVIEGLRPPIFFKLKQPLIQQINKWRANPLLKLYRQTLDIEWQIKYQSLQGNAAAKMLLLQIVVK